MRFLVGMIILFGSVIGGYLGEGGDLASIIQPFEFLIIVGAATAALVVGSSGSVLKQLSSSLKMLFSGPTYTKKDYQDLLSLLYTLFRLARTKGDLALEAHVENPTGSSIFSSYSGFLKDHHAVDFTCDYLRLLTLGISNPMELSDVIDVELDTHHQETNNVVSAVTAMADGLPALGIVAAVLGVVHTMGYISEPPEVLGEMIGAALVGTLTGVLLAYGIVAPIAAALGGAFASDAYYYMAIKVGLIAHMQGYAPQVSVEFSRKILPTDLKPSFQDVDEMLQSIPNPT